MPIKNDILLITLNYHIFQNETYYPDEPFFVLPLDGVCRRLKWGERFATISHNVNQLNPAEEKLTEKEKMDSIGDWENCKGQCGYTQFCRQCMQERDRLIREKEQAERKRMEELYDACVRSSRSG
jgi:hypothetical protein